MQRDKQKHAQGWTESTPHTYGRVLDITTQEHAEKDIAG